MPSHTLAERLKVAAASSATRIAAFDEGEQADSLVVEEVPEAAPVEEKRGVGTPSFDLAGTIAKIKRQIARLQGQDPDKEASLLARIAALKANAGL